MKSHGIILRDWEARAIVEGRKTQMRFIVKHYLKTGPCDIRDIGNGPEIYGAGGVWLKLESPYSVGDQLWGRETWCQRVDDEGFPVYNFERNLDSTCCHYAADGVHVIKVDGDGGIKYRSNGAEASPWSSPVTMPRWASRILLEVTQVRVQRVQDISENDVTAEGIREIKHQHERRWAVHGLEHLNQVTDTAAWSYSRLWNSIHGPDAWDRNDWVWAVTFKRLEGGAA